MLRPVRRAARCSVLRGWRLSGITRKGNVMKRYVSAIVNRQLKGPSITMVLYGVRGGMLCDVDMTVTQATVLRDQLEEAIALMTARPAN